MLNIELKDNRITMNTPPFRTSSGGIGCPRCTTVLQKGKAPFYIRGEKVGIFEAIVCPICNYSALTEKGYEKAILEAKNIGIIGLTEEIPEVVSLELVINQPRMTNNNPHKILGKDDELEGATWIIDDLYSLGQPITVSHFTKKNLSRTR